MFCKICRGRFSTVFFTRGTVRDEDGEGVGCCRGEGLLSTGLFFGDGVETGLIFGDVLGDGVETGLTFGEGVTGGTGD